MKFLLIDFTERVRGEKERDAPLMYAFIGWLLYVPWLWSKPTILLYQDHVVTSWDTQPGPMEDIFKWNSFLPTVLVLPCFVLSCQKIFTPLILYHLKYQHSEKSKWSLSIFILKNNFYLMDHLSEFPNPPRLHRPCLGNH